MHPSLQGATLWHHLKQTGLVLLLIAVLTLLGVVAAGMSHAQQGAVPTGRLMAPIGTTNDPPTSSLATTNGSIHVGDMAVSEGDIHIES